MKNFVKPNWKKSIVNISATIAEYLHVPNHNPTIKVLKDKLNKNYRNIVFIIFDALGMYPLLCNAEENSFLLKHVEKVLTSTFPSTTTNATTSMLTNSFPNEHGWFGWSLYFEELKKAIDIFISCDSFSGEEIEKDYARKVLPVEPYYLKAQTDYEIHKVVPDYWTDGSAINKHDVSQMKDYFKEIKNICKQEGKHFIYCYSPEPDGLMHKFGVTSDVTKQAIREIDQQVEHLANELQDSLIVISADHGQVNVTGYYELYQDKELLSLLEWPNFLDSRTPAFKVKKGHKREFVKMFNLKYGNDFMLLSSKFLISHHYFGQNNQNSNYHLLGDYIAVSRGGKIMIMTPRSHYHLGHHASLTKEEMEVPLIIIETPKTK